MRHFAATLPYITVTDMKWSSRLERFLWDRMSNSEIEGIRFVNLSEVPPSTFSDRLGSVINTWYQMSLVGDDTIYFCDNPDPTTNPVPYGYDFAQLPADVNISKVVVDELCKLFCLHSTQATLTHLLEVYTYSKLSLGLLFLCSGVLLATGVASSVLRRRTLAPDMLGYMTSMTYNNRYLALPYSARGELDAMRRVRMLRDLRVSLSNVCGDEKVGRLAFTADANVRALEKGRKYV